MADSVMTYKLVVKEIAMKHGVYASFMPKPMEGVPGNGMHAHLSLFDEEEEERVLRRVGRVGLRALVHGQALHRRHPGAREGALSGDEPVRQLLQAPLWGNERSFHHRLGAPQSLDHGAHTRIQAEQRRRLQGRAAQPRPGLQPLPGAVRNACRRARRHREEDGAVRPAGGPRLLQDVPRADSGARAWRSFPARWARPSRPSRKAA